MPLPGLDIETTTNTEGVWIRLRGETDMSTHEQLVAGAPHPPGAGRLLRRAA
jgi:hypothetical protein